MSNKSKLNIFNNKNSMKNNKSKGVSEVIGYILTFSIVVLIVSTVYTAGMPMINDMKDTSAVQSIEVAFFTLQSTIGRTAVGQSPTSVIGLNIARGSMGVNQNSGTITIYSDGTPQEFNFSSIEYTLGHRKIIYELGAVIVSHDGVEGIITSEPPIFFTNDTRPHAFISVINATGEFSVAGGFANMNIEHGDTRVHNSSCGTSFVNITIRGTQFPRAWHIFFNNAYEDAFGYRPDSDYVGYNHNYAFLNMSRTQPSNLTLVTHNLTIS